LAAADHFGATVKVAQIQSILFVLRSRSEADWWRTAKFAAMPAATIKHSAEQSDG
jgi:hypothetical protein